MSPARETQSMREIRHLRGTLPCKGGGLTSMASTLHPRWLLLRKLEISLFYYCVRMLRCSRVMDKDGFLTFWFYIFLNLPHDFISSAKEQYSVLHGMQKKMALLYKDMGKFYAFDIKKYTMEEFFQDLKTFKDSFSVSIIMFGKQKFIWMISLLYAKWKCCFYNNMAMSSADKGFHSLTSLSSLLLIVILLPL